MGDADSDERTGDACGTGDDCVQIGDADCDERMGDADSDERSGDACGSGDDCVRMGDSDERSVMLAYERVFLRRAYQHLKFSFAQHS